MASPAAAERASLCDLFVEVGPDAPTLCGDWTTRDLAAHLVVRERRPDGAVGIVAKPLAGYGEKVRLEEAARPWPELIERVRSGPPRWSPTRLASVDRVVNTVEFFVHHEDVRRAKARWTERNLDVGLSRDLLTALGRMGKLLVRRAPVGLTLAVTDGPGGTRELALHDGEPAVTVSGHVGELVLYVYGRQDHAVVDHAGPADAVDALRTASFGI